MKKEAEEDYEAQILELRTTLKECKDLLVKEHLVREKVYRSFLREQFQHGQACKQIKNINMEIYDQTYVELKNDRQYWQERFR